MDIILKTSIKKESSMAETGLKFWEWRKIFKNLPKNGFKGWNKCTINLISSLTSWDLDWTLSSTTHSNSNLVQSLRKSLIWTKSNLNSKSIACSLLDWILKNLHPSRKLNEFVIYSINLKPTLSKDMKKKFLFSKIKQKS